MNGHRRPFPPHGDFTSSRSASDEAAEEVEDGHNKLRDKLVDHFYFKWWRPELEWPRQLLYSLPLASVFPFSVALIPPPFSVFPMSLRKN